MKFRAKLYRLNRLRRQIVSTTQDVTPLDWFSQTAWLLKKEISSPACFFETGCPLVSGTCSTAFVFAEKLSPHQGNLVLLNKCLTKCLHLRKEKIQKIFYSRSDIGLEKRGKGWKFFYVCWTSLISHGLYFFRTKSEKCLPQFIREITSFALLPWCCFSLKAYFNVFCKPLRHKRSTKLLRSLFLPLYYKKFSLVYEDATTTN